MPNVGFLIYGSTDFIHSVYKEWTPKKKREEYFKIAIHRVNCFTFILWFFSLLFNKNKRVLSFLIKIIFDKKCNIIIVDAIQECLKIATSWFDRKHNIIIDNFVLLVLYRLYWYWIQQLQFYITSTGSSISQSYITSQLGNVLLHLAS